MKTRLLVITYCLLTLCSSSLFAEDLSRTTLFYRFRDSSERFELDLPQIWEVIRTAKAALLAGAPRDSRTSKFRPNVNLIVDYIDLDASLDDLFHANISFAQSSLKQFRIVSSSTLTLGSLSAMKLVYVCRVLSKGVELDMKNIVYCTMQNKMFYILTCSSLVDQFEDYQAIFERIGNSLRIY